MTPVGVITINQAQTVAVMKKMRLHLVKRRGLANPKNKMARLI
jgi:hypothetical protein